jgi:GAF domain-containing protein
MTDPDDDWLSEDRPTSDVATLRESLAVAERRAAALAELTALMSEGRNPLELAQRAVELTARAARAAGAFVYLWDRDDERLVLRVATDGWQRGHLGNIKLRLGEGITGWVALMRQTVVLAEDPQKDPRFKHFPELREGSFRSMVAVPIVAPGEDVLGVFTLYALKKNAFSAADVNLASEVGALLASGLVQAETLSRLKTQSAAAQFLRDLPEDAWGSLEGCLQAMAVQCAAALDADACIVEVTTDHAQPRRGRHGVAVSPAFRESHLDHASRRGLDRPSLLQALAPLDLQRLRIPLGAGTPIGAVTCYRTRKFTSEDEVLLEGIGAQVAAGALSLYGTERVRPALDQLFLAPDAATTEQILRRYGWKVRPTWAAVIRVQTTNAAELRTPGEDRVRLALEDVFGSDGSEFLLLGGGGRYLALAEAADPARRDALAGRLGELGRQPSVRVSAGVGPVGSDIQELHRAIRHALHASYWAELAAPADGEIVRYEDVAHLRLLPRIALARSGDLRTLIDALGAVVRYDLDNSTDLAKTLDSFLTSSGSVAKSSAGLFIHRNTLRQRIQRIEELIGQSPENFEDWVTAGMAVCLIHESETEISKQPGQRAKCPLGVVTIGRACCGLPSNCVHAPGKPGRHR